MNFETRKFHEIHYFMKLLHDNFHDFRFPNAAGENFVERKGASSNLKGLFDDFSNQQNLMKITPLCSFAGQGC